MNTKVLEEEEATAEEEGEDEEENTLRQPGRALEEISQLRRWDNWVKMEE